MRDYVKRIRAEFGGATKLAHFLGVATVTVESWAAGKRTPRDEHERMLYLLGRLMTEAPDLFATMAGTSKPALPTLPPMPAPSKQGSEWSDDYWFVRTVTRQDFEQDEQPEVFDGPEVFARMTEAREARYWASLKDYEQRTGRIKPD